MSKEKTKILSGNQITPEVEEFHGKLWEASVAALNDGISANMILGSFLSLGLDLMWMSGMTEEEAASVFSRFANTTKDYYDARVEELN
jgi:hypothetical protein